MPSALASISAYCTFGLAFGWTPLFSLSPDILQSLTFDNPLELLPYTMLALFCVVMAMIYTRTFYGMVYLFHQIRLPRHFVPAIGAFLSGLLGLLLYYLFGHEKKVLAVLSFGYGSLQDAMTLSPGDSTLFMALILLAIALGKIMTTGLTIGSGGSGGVFGPSMVIGGCGGGALGISLHWVWPALAPHPTNFIIVGMAGFFAAAAKTPFSTLVIVSEMTGSYSLLLPTLWVCTLAFLLSDEQSIYSSQVDGRNRSPAHQAEFVKGMLSGLSVGQFVERDEKLPVLQLQDRLDAVLSRMSNDPHTVLPVTDADGKLLGVVSLEEVYLATQILDAPSVILIADLMRSDVVPLRFSDTIDHAMELFAEHELLELPVIDENDSERVVGTVRRANISSTYLRRVQGSIHK